jgi:hypothetical protein
VETRISEEETRSGKTVSGRGIELVNRVPSNALHVD